MSSTETPKICLLMATYNGGHFLKAQLQSIEDQTYTNWSLHVSDDGSQDDTLTTLEAFQAQHPKDRVTLYSGPKKGFAANFLSLVCNDRIAGDYFAYADHDDVWNPNKLEHALAWITHIPPHIPALYAARTCLTNENNDPIGFSTKWTKKPHFKNALVQCIASGNTMLFNHAARLLLQKYSQNITVISHDWWSYLVVTGCGGIVFYDPTPTIFYRQHDKNAIGRNDTIHAKLFRVTRLFRGDFKKWNSQHMLVLSKMRSDLTPANQKTFDQFNEGRQLHLLKRLFLLSKSGIYRQTLLGNLGLITAAVFNKI